MSFRRKIGDFDLDRLLAEDDADIKEKIDGGTKDGSPEEITQSGKEGLAEKIGEIIGCAIMGAAAGMLLKYILGI